MSIRDNYYIYHLTAFENMRSILLYGLQQCSNLLLSSFQIGLESLSIFPFLW